MSSEYRMSISLNVLNHLGLHLYSNTPAVLSEVIANAWDADATTVKVNFDLDAKTITVTDDGHGMDLDDINQKYLYVGFEKRAGGQTRTPSGRRLPMGRKGIGKISLFSIARRFGILGEKHGFRIVLDSKEVTFADRDYFHKARFLFQYGDYDYTQHCNRLDVDKATGEKLSFTRSNRFDGQGEANGNGNYEVHGWIAVAHRSNDLDDREEQDNLNKITVAVRGKVALEDILNEYRLGGMITTTSTHINRGRSNSVSRHYHIKRPPSSLSSSRRRS